MRAEGRGLGVAILLLAGTPALHGQSPDRAAVVAAVDYIRSDAARGVGRAPAESVFIDVDSLTLSSSRTDEALASLAARLRSRVAIGPATACARSASVWAARLERAQCALRAARYYVEVEEITITGATGRVWVHVYWKTRPGECCSVLVMFAFYEVIVERGPDGWRGVRVQSIVET